MELASSQFQFHNSQIIPNSYGSLNSNIPTHQQSSWLELLNRKIKHTSWAPISNSKYQINEILAPKYYPKMKQSGDTFYPISSTFQPEDEESENNYDDDYFSFDDLMEGNDYNFGIQDVVTKMTTKSTTTTPPPTTTSTTTKTTTTTRPKKTTMPYLYDSFRPEQDKLAVPIPGEDRFQPVPDGIYTKFPSLLEIDQWMDSICSNGHVPLDHDIKCESAGKTNQGRRLRYLKVISKIFYVFFLISFNR